MNNMLTVEEVKSYLDIEQSQIEQYLAEGKLHAYKIGGTYLRFRKEEVANLRYSTRPTELKPAGNRNVFSILGDFWRFNNFYIVSLVAVVAAVIWMIQF